LIRVAMLYGDKVGYGPTVRDALDGIFGAGAGVTATGPAPTGPVPPAGQPQPQKPEGPAPEVPVAVVPPSAPGTAVQISAAKAAALADVQAAMNAVQQAQRSGNFAEYGQALQRLDDAMTKYGNAK
jgi:uncharacterized membrane protein (UPF0182 family)